MKDSTRKVIFRRSDENRVVLEEGIFRDSLFQEQYLSAMRSFIDVCRAMNPELENVSNIVAFCGDRGEGKSSCMQTMRQILVDKELFKVEDNTSNEHERQYIAYSRELKQYPIYALKVIDPSFFDETHNILDLVISRLYQEAFYGEDVENETKAKYKERYQLIRCFDRVKESMSLLEKNRKEIFDNIESLGRLAESMKLRENVSVLFEEFIKYKNKQEGSENYSKILICIDDLDLNVNGGYTMLEQIRKYLSNPNCVILMALKIEQMTKVVQNALYANSGNNEEIITHEMCRDMAEKYITKLFPNEHRVQMPKVEDIVDYRLELHYDYELSKSNSTKPEPWTSIKEAVVSLIFLKTRYLFYNREADVNLVIPRNLRSLRQLVAMLLQMDNFVKGSRISKENQNAFKKYFFNEWTNVLPEEQKEMVHDIISYNDVSTKNHYVLSSLLQPGLIGADTELFKWFNARVRAYNVSVGDVLYAIQYLQETGHADLRELLFFLRSYYSMCLYDYYDELVGEVEYAEDIPAIYAYQKYYWNGDDVVEREEEMDKHVEIYAYDERFKGISKLQQLVGGAYYMYEPGELLPEEAVNIRDQHTRRQLFNSMPRDYRALDGYAIFQFMRKYGLTNLTTAQIASDESKLLAFQMCEFFALTTKMIQTADESRNGNYRYRYYPYYLTSFKRGNTIVLFDVMAIFSNIINIAFAYDRFNEALWGRGTKQSFFEVALKQKGSLLNQLLAPYEAKANEEEYEEPLRSAFTLGRFASAGIIRNVDVHQSLLAKVKAEKESLSKNATNGSDNAGRLIDFYLTIRNSEIMLYGGADAKLEELYHINYEKLLDPVIKFLENIQKNAPDTFKDLFTTYEERIHSFKQGFKLVGDMDARDGEYDVESESQVQWPQSINGVDTSYLSAIYEEISEIDWSQKRDGKYIKDHMSDASRNALVYPLNSSITSKQTYKSAEEFMQKLMDLIRKNSDRLKG